MRYRIKTHQDFDKEFKRLCKKYSSLKADLSALGKSLSENPDQGTSLGKGVRKVRMAIVSKGKGKSHGARVITYTEAIVCADNEGTVILLTIYDKADRDSISAAEIDELLRSLRWELYIMYLQPIITQYFIDNKSEIWLLFLIAHSKR